LASAVAEAFLTTAVSFRIESEARLSRAVFFILKIGPNRLPPPGHYSSKGRQPAT